MSEIAAATILRSAAGATVQPAVAPTTGGGGNGSGTALLLPQPHPTLAALEAGDIIEVTLAGRAPDGRVYLTMPQHGRLIVMWPGAPAIGTTLRLQVALAGNPPHLLPLPGTEPPVQREARPAAATLPTPPSARPQPATPPPFGPSPIIPGRMLTAAFNPLPMPGSQAAARPLAPTGAAPQVTLQVLGLAAPGLESPKGPAGSQTATVTQVHGDRATWRTPAGTLTISDTISPPVGTRLTVQVAAPFLATPPLAPIAAADGLFGDLTRGWPALEQVLQIGQQAQPEAAARLTNTILAQPGPRLTTGLVFFLSAVVGGRLGDWLGDDMRQALRERGDGALLTRLGDDFSQLTRLATEPVGDWRTALIPLLHNGVLRQLRVYLRDRNRSDTDGASPSGTRFVVEASLGGLGELQLDGLVRNRRFDLVVRTHEPLPELMQTEIQRIFKRAGADTDYAGSLSFHVAAEFPAAPPKHPSGAPVGLFA